MLRLQASLLDGEWHSMHAQDLEILEMQPSSHQRERVVSLFRLHRLLPKRSPLPPLPRQML